MELGSRSFKVMEVRHSASPISTGDLIVSIDGLGVNDCLGSLLNGKPRPFEGKIRVKRGQEILEYSLAYEPINLLGFVHSIWPYLLLALCLVGCGGFAYLYAPSGQSAGLFAACYAVFALNVINDMGLCFGVQPPYVISMIFFMAMVTNWLGFSLWTHFLCNFPVKQCQLMGMRPLRGLLIYGAPPAVSVILALLSQGPQGAIYSGLQRFRFWHIPFVVLFTLVSTGREFLNTKNHLIKNQLKWLILGGMAGILPYLVFYLMPILILGSPFCSFKFVVLFAFLIPLSFLFAMIRFKLMDIDDIVRSTVTYFLLISALVISYVALLLLYKHLFWGNRLLTQWSFFIYILTIAILFDPAKNKLKSRIDKAFFKDKINYDRLLHKYSRKVASLLELSRLIKLLIEKIPADFRITRGCVMILEGRRSRLFPEHLRFGKYPWSQSAVVRELKKADCNLIRCDEPNPGDEALSEELAEIQRAGFVLALPLKSITNFLGIYFLGPKRGGQPYSSNELQALSTLATHVSTAMENALMYESLANSKQQLKEIYSQLIQSEKMAVLGEMASTVAHEIRNPLGIIRSSAQFLAEGRNYEDSDREVLEFIVEEADRLNQVVTNLLQYARFKPPAFKELYLDEVLEQLIENWQKGPDHRDSVTITISGSSGRAPIYADEKQLCQVFMNLIQNSEEAMPQGGEIKISLEPDEQEEGIFVTIQDSGHGVPEDVAQKVFHKFFTTKENGLGLGLAVCQQIIEAHNGLIEFESQPGMGTTVTIWLPKRPHAAVGGLV